MAEDKTITGRFWFDQDSKRYYRFQVKAQEGIVGTIYIPKDKEMMPKNIILEDVIKDS